MDLNDLNKVWEIKPLNKIGEDEARKILEKVAKQVQPIMRKRKWKVKILSEFCPSNPSLLGLNIGGGAEVKLRLRRPNRDWDFFPYEQILDTMLHELCHNEYGPHNAEFYNLLDEIRKDLIFPGRRLSGFSTQPPLSSLRQSALAAAENRARHGALLPSGPNRLGGDSNIKAILSPIQAAAMAAERRLHDDSWCGSKTLESENNIGSTTGTSQTTNTISNGRFNQTSSIESTPGPEAVDVGRHWHLICEACGSQRQKRDPKLKVWSCKFCTLENSSESERCLACGEWRYSYGPSVSTHAPFLGT
ncbi:hypothetical protein Patl1_34865 [Pistacia atlantica]|uniref:Uncharacterized protein n=1 Tax=Pistacia atlantica TaxID=434234 RepID=A0ACC0ZXE9_9ROSI|nr:hypothetical protein Patl1_34865 [Pistacia atlantica]